MATKEEIQAVLVAAEAELAAGISTPEELAVRLLAAGCQGHRNSPHDCPATRWFRQKLEAAGIRPPKGTHVIMTSSYTAMAWVGRRADREEDGYAIAALSAVIERFIDLFDNRDPARRNPFPELDLGEEEEEHDTADE